ncbi:MAG: hypothetical protein COV10_02980 [Candidatus Vogelbacteria bacterium CG10_big_fil_rev_8_21_14_0_10_51_16]|uniref:Uncharacterized protein n=1 Tax=Candidatus Vogelbacteria bacterium CG10_big_fil_rev_8_21_14_0_10_51_16 TaxID=1975045 RepID=A0A2H0RE45_9BACT|nr:MAG: hypothetical protein COV10_02980 [Candidatus Vogelbacteria bacterium CG10_big_fil_rev_8_21_14_0_10_51_16]
MCENSRDENPNTRPWRKQKGALVRKYRNRIGDIAYLAIGLVFLLLVLAGTLAFLMTVGSGNQDGTAGTAQPATPHGHEAVAKALNDKETLPRALGAIAENMKEMASDISKPQCNFELGPWKFKGVGSGVFVVYKGDGYSITPIELARLVAFVKVLVAKAEQETELGPLEGQVKYYGEISSMTGITFSGAFVDISRRTVDGSE